MSVNGYLKIKTKIDNSEIPKGVQELEDKIKKVKTENSKLSNEEKGLQEEINAYKKLQAEADKYNQELKELKVKKQEMFNNNKSLAVGADTAEYTKVKADIDSINMKYKQTVIEIDKQFSKIEKLHSKLDKIKSKQAENNDKISQYKQKIESIKTQHIENSINNVGKGLTNQISKINQMALGIIGISTAWGAVRSAISLVSQYNSQVATDIDYMKYALANALAPIVQKLISMAFTLLSYLNAITTAWFGINLFSNSTAKNFQKMKKSASSTAKSAKEIQKSLQGFDEMNVLQDNSSKTNPKNEGGGTGNVPSMDLSSMQVEPPEWLQWIIDNKDLILQVLAGVVAGITAIKLGASGLVGLGIGLLVAGIVGFVQDLITFLNDPTWNNFLNLLEDIAIAFVGIGIIIGALTGNWIPLIVAAIALIVVEVIKHWDEICAILIKVGEWVYNNVVIPVWNFIQALVDTIVSIFWGLLNTFYGICTTLGAILRAPFQTAWDFIKDMFNSIVTIIKGIAQVFKGIFTGDIKTTLNGFKLIFKGIFDALWGIVKAPLNLIIRGLNALIKGANQIGFDVPDWVPGLGGKQFRFNISEIPLLAKGTVVSKPTPAIVGDAGAEAVMPLENHTEWIDYLADKIASKIGSGGGAYILNIDGRTVLRGIAKREQELSFAMNGR